MLKKDIFEIIANIVDKDIGYISALDPNLSLSDVGLDSIKFIQMIVNIEEKYKFEFSDSDLLMDNFSSINVLLTTLNKYINNSKTQFKKVVVCDCDNVLWHGVAGEEDIYVDEKIVSFQEKLVDLNTKGILLCLCSKNSQENIDYAFDMLSMPLKKEHILIEKINYYNKAQNISDISSELNLSYDSFIFVDDSDYELGLIQSMLPEVETLKADYSSMSFVDELIVFFDKDHSTTFNRTKLYKDQKEREKGKKLCLSLEEYNQSLQTIINCHHSTIDEVTRIAELSQRTNQFNLSCRRHTPEEICKFIEDDTYIVFSLSITDKYGDMGIVGSAIIHYLEGKAIIEDFYVSCRAFDRGVESELIARIKEETNDYILYGLYVPSDKNKRYCDFYITNGVGCYANNELCRNC